MVGLRDSVRDLISDKFNQAYEHIFMVKLPWVESNLYADNFGNKKTSFTLNSTADVPEFIKICTGLDEQIRLQNKKVSAIKAVGLGGLGVTCLKMCTDKIGFDLSYDLALDRPENIFKDQFYSFLISTSENAEGFEKFLKNHFAKCPVDIRKIGETRPNEIKFSNELSLNHADFRNSYEAGLGMVNL